MIPFFLRKPAGAAVLVLLVLALAGCGRRGALEPPPGAEWSTPSSGPVSASIDAAATVAPVTETTPAAGESAKPAKKRPATQPMFKSFFLDPFVN